MRVFKTSMQRKLFIDKKIRENTYPTAVSLAKDYEKECNIKIDPRTIASDIAELRNMYKAPLKYDAKQKGYYYTDTSFKINILAIDGAGLMASDNAVRDIIIPDWQKTLLFSFMNEVLPQQKDATSKCNFFNEQITVLPSGSDIGSTANIENTFNKALKNNIVLSIEKSTGLVPKERYDFLPLHLICLGDKRIYFGKEFIKGNNGASSYILFNLDIVESAAISYSEDIIYEKQKEIADGVTSNGESNFYAFAGEKGITLQKERYTYYAQTTGNNDIEIIMLGEKVKHVFIFTCFPSIKNKEKNCTYQKVGEFILNSLD